MLVLRCGAAAFAAAAACMTGSVHPASAQVTVLVATHHEIEDIDADSSWLVWRHDRGPRRRQPSCVTVIRRRSWATGALATLYRCTTEDLPEEMAVTGSTVVWTRNVLEFGGCCDSEFDMRLRRVGSRTPLDRAYRQFGCGGDELGPLDAYAGMAAYTKSIWTSTFCPGNPDTGRDSMTGGDVRLFRARSGSPSVIAGTPPAAFLALSPTRLVLVPYDLAAGTINFPPPPKPEVLVWSLDSRARERTIPETGTIAAVAIRKAHLAVLVSDGSGNYRIDRFIASTGAADGSSAVPGSVQPQLAMWRAFVVYAAGHTVRALNTATDRTRIVARIRRRPYDVLAVRGRAIWLSAGPLLSRISSAPIR